MHMADALLTPAVGCTLWCVAALCVRSSAHSLQLSEEDKLYPLMGVLGAFTFAAQMVNFALPGTGASGHIVGGVLLAALLGPAAGFLTLSVVLLLQALIFADGGILAYGANLLNMGFSACYVAYYLVYEPLTRQGKQRIYLASILSSLLSLQIGALAVVIETTLSGVTALPFTTFLLLMQPIHLLIGLVEGIVTGAVLTFVAKAGVGLVNASDWAQSKGRLKWGFALATVVLAGIASRYASSLPDGLEWSLERILGTDELSSSSLIAQGAAIIQKCTSIMADYSFLGQDNSSMSGLCGAALVCLVCAGAGKLLYRRKRRDEEK